MTFALFLAAGAAKDLAVLLAYRSLNRFRNSTKLCSEWCQRKRIPWAGGWLAKRVRPHSKFVDQRNQKIVDATRWFVNTESFDHIVALALDGDLKPPGWMMPAEARRRLAEVKSRFSGMGSQSAIPEIDTRVSII